MLTELEKKIIASIQEDIVITKRPYLEISRKLGISEDVLLETLESLCRRGVIRRFGATLRHQQTGYKANAMVAWKVPEERVEEVGNIMASFREITHCYRRNPAPGWDKNLYTMVHAANETDCRATASRMAEQAAVTERDPQFFQVLVV